MKVLTALLMRRIMDKGVLDKNRCNIIAENKRDG